MCMQIKFESRAVAAHIYMTFDRINMTGLKTPKLYVFRIRHFKPGQACLKGHITI
jgi:hypothetical protein